MQTGAEINTEQPWRNTFTHVPDAKDAHFLVKAPDGSSEEVPAQFAGLGIYRAAYTVKQAGDYTVSLLFTDPANQARIGESDNAYTLAVAPAVAEAPPQAPQALPATGAGGDPALPALLVIAAGALMLATGLLRAYAKTP